MDYFDKLEEGLKLYSDIDVELRKISKQSNVYCDLEYCNNRLMVKTERNNISAEFTISIYEVIELSFEKSITVKDAVGELLKEKACKNAKIE